MDLMALFISGTASMTPMIAPPISMPMPSGRYNIKRSESGELTTAPVASSGKLSVADNIGDKNQ